MLTLKFYRDKLLRISCLVVVFIAVICLGSYDLAVAQRPPPGWIDFEVSKVTVTPSVPGVGELVVFHAQVRIVQADLAYQVLYVQTRCLLDEKTWSEETLVFSGKIVVEIFARLPWNATSGQHVVSWTVDPNQMYADTDLRNNTAQYSFAVGSQSPDFDFGISASPTWQATKVGETSWYQVNVYVSRPETETIRLSMQSTPPGLPYSLSAPSSRSSFWSILSLQSRTIPAGVYYLNVTASGQTRSHSVTLTLVVEQKVKGNSSISITVDAPSLALGSNATIRGTIMPPHGAWVTLKYIRPDGLTFATVLRSESDGNYTYNFSPDTTGSWAFSAKWAGDEDNFGAESNSITVSVNEAPVPPVSPLSQFLEQLEAVPMDILNVIALVLAILLVLSLFSGFVLVGI